MMLNKEDSMFVADRIRQITLYASGKFVGEVACVQGGWSFPCGGKTAVFRPSRMKPHNMKRIE